MTNILLHRAHAFEIFSSLAAIFLITVALGQTLLRVVDFVLNAQNLLMRAVTIRNMAIPGPGWVKTDR